MAIDRDIKGEDVLGISFTNPKGEYEIEYEEKDFRKTKKEKGGPELFIRVFDQKENLIIESEVIFNAGKDETINIDLIDPLGDNEIGSIPTSFLLERFSTDKRAETINLNGTLVNVSGEKISVKKITEKLEQRGIFSREAIAEKAFGDFSITEEAKSLGISELALTRIVNYAIGTIPKRDLDSIKEIANQPKFEGNIPTDDPEYDLIINELGIADIKEVSIDDIKEWTIFPEVFYVYFGAQESVDLRPYLGEARNQGGRGTCTAFCANAVVEAMEFFRDPRNKPIDLSEELTFWYSKHGQLHSAGGYSGVAALKHYAEFGGCEEYYLPYNGTQMGSNHAHVPVPDVAIDRAQFYKNGTVVNLPIRNIAAVKETLKTGRCVGLISGTSQWSTSTGQITMPSPLDSMGPGSSHCTTIVGFIDRNDLHEDLEGGFFIVRNSWGGNNSTTHLLGKEYNGHLLMPYGWYRRYSNGAYTMVDTDGTEEDRKWQVEYYDNKTLQGAPLKTVSAQLSVFGLSVDLDVPKEINELDFDWGTGSALKFEFPVFIDHGSLPLKDNFSIRFTKLKRFKEGYYKFKLTGDDGIRLYIDDQLVINQWKLQSATAYTAQHYLTGGDHILRVEYYENGVSAEVALEIEAIEFTHSLFTNDNASGTPAQTFTDTRTNIEWRHAPPVIQAWKPGAFSMRSEGRLFFKGGSYQFHALHTGGCRIWIDNNMVLDDWTGANNTGAPVDITQGEHDVKVEFKHAELVPAMGSGSFYRAALHFGWSERFWLTDFHHDQVRWDIREAGWPNPDSHYEAFRTLSLTGTKDLTYKHQDISSEPWNLNFNKIQDFLDLLPSPLESDVVSLHMRRRIFISEGAYYNAKLECDDGHRLIINGKEVVEDHHLTGPDKRNQDIYLKAGYHEVAIEYANTKWGGRLKFNLEKVGWSVEYFDSVNFETSVDTKTLNSLSEVTTSLPVGLSASTYSVRAKRTIWLPIGRYRFQLRGDDGVRLKINGITEIDGWAVQAPKNYHTYYEHKGGELKLEVEYFENTGGEALDFFLIPEGFYGEYYKGITLEKPGEDSDLDRNVPIAYRFEPTIDFDWGSGNRLDRVGSNNFSARWRGKVPLPVGRYRVEVKADDGFRLFIDGRIVMSEWSTRGSVKTFSKKIDLVGRLHEVKLEYFEASGNATCKLAFFREF